MKRNLEQMAQESFDLVIIGGGISGACVAWDAILRGLSVALIEKSDFGAATSAATSKLAHGGLRYLKNLEFDLVRESLRERRILEQIAPHLVIPLPFLVPTYKDSPNNRVMLYPGMVFYDLLSFDKGWLDDPDRKMPRFKSFTAQQVRDMEPGVETNGLTGGVLYYDGQIISPDRLTLSFLTSAASRGARLANYAQVVDLLMEDKRVLGVKVKDNINQSEHEIRGKITVNCSGPWADLVLGMTKTKTDKHVLRSQGIHIVTRKIVGNNALVLLTPTLRHYFVIPWRGLTLIGTTDTKYEGDPDTYHVTEEAVAELIQEVNASYPGGKLTRDDVMYAYGGLRPIVEKDTQVDSYKASRKYEIYDHKKDEGLEGLVSVIGGKYTTSRYLGKQITDLVVKKLKDNVADSQTDHIPLAGGNISIFRDFLANLMESAPSGISDITLEYLANHYGTLTRNLFDLVRKNPELGEPLGESRPDIAAQIVYAARNEMAQTVLDVALRRTGVGTIGHPGRDVLEKIADLMAAELDWTDEQRAKSLDQADDHLKRAGIGG